ncbi:hypothetical protein Patl1_02544 [Pistacia atlantica]|uniref:Uncharacterized protein n=1 Tax=Pistacia atlantica TaxID=434234 RepID=A0ACC1C4Y1_9ROSI|nr:hypothetical protein Patl1_02544 [Pistacia atlantica]
MTRQALLFLFYVVLFLVSSCVESEYKVYNTSQGIVPGKLNVHLVAHTHDDVGWLKTVDQYYVGSNNSIQGACVQNILDSLIPALLADKNRKFIYVEQVVKSLTSPKKCKRKLLAMSALRYSGAATLRKFLSPNAMTVIWCLCDISFQLVIAFFQRWWREQSEAMQQVVRQLVSSGQLEFINGGMSMHDEAVTHYIDMIDQTTLGHRFIKNEFGVTPRIGWQIDPFGHSAVQAYLLGADVGFDSLFFGRIDYQDRTKRKNEKSLEVIWQGSRNFRSSAQIFAGAFPKNYEPPPGGFYFEVNDDSPIVQDDINLFDYNVQDRVNDFVAAAVSQVNRDGYLHGRIFPAWLDVYECNVFIKRSFIKANITRTNHIMWTMGTDFKYQYAHTWFRQMDKLIHYVNMDGRVNALYSTPSIYTDAKYAANEFWPLKIDDFFPYADRANAYWTGYFSSRPALKRYVRMMSGYYLAARQLEFFKGRSNTGPNTDSLADALAIAQHHDAVTGTEKQHVADDYAKRLSIGHMEAEGVVATSLACLADSMSYDGCNRATLKFQQAKDLSS